MFLPRKFVLDALYIKANSHIPCRAPAMLLCKRLLKATAGARRAVPVDGLWVICQASDFSVYHAEFHEGHGTVGGRQGHGTACVN
jgi:hypothetical protein